MAPTISTLLFVDFDKAVLEDSHDNEVFTNIHTWKEEAWLLRLFSYMQKEQRSTT